MDRIPEQEIWMPIQGFSDYAVSNHGRVMNIKRLSFKTLSVCRDGYIKVRLLNNKNAVDMRIHRLVAEHFIPNPEGKKEVNHLANKTDNQVWNLEWVTRDENLKHARGKCKTKKVPVKRIDLTTGEEKIYATFKDVVAEGFTTNAVRYACNRTGAKSGGYHWEYVDRNLGDTLENEVWLPVKDSIYSEINVYDAYKVSNMGRVMGFNCKILSTNWHGSCGTVCFVKDKQQKRFSIHRLVLMTFNVPNPELKQEVDHIDSDYKNNRLDNLRWATRIENMANVTTKARSMVPIRRTCTDTGEIKDYPSIDSVIEDDLKPIRVSSALYRQGTYAGYKWTRREIEKES